MKKKRCEHGLSMPASMLAIVLGLCLGAAGCVSLPPVHSGETPTKQVLVSHVSFLSQPGLKGRKPRTAGSRLARRYVESRFTAYGLVPWGKEKGYELSFGYGKNVVGILPGSDPNLAGEIVLLSAHYDHLGKDHQGRICPGAADNASGVAVLLETARQLSLLEPRPKRSVAFAAFDCEEQMLFGAFAFSSRSDVQGARLAAVVNLDILGRDFLDVVRKTVFVAGTEEYPEIRERVCRSGTEAGIRVLAVGSDLIGPRGDHAAFESRPVPCLFFSSGLYRDYHQPTDTADKLNYADLERSATVVLATVRELANGQKAKRVTTAAAGDLEELRSVCAVLSEVCTNGQQAGIKSEDAETFKKLDQQAEALLKSGRYDRKTRAELIVGASGTLAPYLLSFGPDKTGRKAEEQKNLAMAMQYLQQFYLRHRTELMSGYRELVEHILKYRPGPFRGMPKFEYEIYDVADEDISLADAGGGKYALNALINELTLKAEAKTLRWLVKSFGGELTATLEPISCEGTREQVIDFCLLKLRSQQSNEVHSIQTRKVLQVACGAEARENDKQLLAERLKRGGFKDETEWLVHCAASDSPDLALEAIGSANTNRTEAIRDAACKTFLDRNRRADVRAAAMDLAMTNQDQRVLLALCEMLDDTTPACRKEYLPMLRKGYPFADRLEIKTLRPILEKQFASSPNASKTIADLAHEQLKKVAKRDLGKDRLPWRKWVEANAARHTRR